jgi:hypothetical protein
LFLFQALLLFLFPLGLYCLVLAHVNRRERPLLFSGMWDVVLMLAGGAGFFLVLIPVLLVELYQRSVLGPGNAGDTFARLFVRWGLLWLLYYVTLIGGALALISWRRHKTVIYNVDTDLFPAAFAQAARLAGLEYHGYPGHPERIILTLNPPLPTAVSTEPLPAFPPLRREVALVNLEFFPAGCHVTIHWEQYEPALRRVIEQNLDKILEQARPTDNPLAGWFLVISGLIFGLIALVVLAVLLIYYRTHG